MTKEQARQILANIPANPTSQQIIDIKAAARRLANTAFTVS